MREYIGMSCVLMTLYHLMTLYQFYYPLPICMTLLTYLPFWLPFTIPHGYVLYYALVVTLYHISSEIETKIEDAKVQITEYKEDLQKARVIRRHRQEYDALAKVYSS